MNEENTIPEQPEVPKQEQPTAEIPESVQVPEPEKEIPSGATDLLANLLGGLSGSLDALEQVKVESGRPYTAIAKKGEAKLCLNVDIELGHSNHPTKQGAKMAVIALVLRTIEINTQVSQFSSIFPIRDSLEKDNGFLRGPKISILLCDSGPPSHFRRMWGKQEVTEKILEWLKAKVATVPGAEIILSDEVLVMVIESRLDHIPAEEHLLFQTPK